MYDYKERSYFFLGPCVKSNPTAFSRGPHRAFAQKGCVFSVAGSKHTFVISHSHGRRMFIDWIYYDLTNPDYFHGRPNSFTVREDYFKYWVLFEDFEYQFRFNDGNGTNPQVGDVVMLHENNVYNLGLVVKRDDRVHCNLLDLRGNLTGDIVSFENYSDQVRVFNYVKDKLGF